MDAEISLIPDLPEISVRSQPRRDIRTAHAEFLAALSAPAPAPIAREPAPEEFTARAICCETLIETVRRHLHALIAEAAANDPARFVADAELGAAVDAHLGDLQGDITGTLGRIAERIRDERYDGCPRGPFHRRRRG